MFKILEAEQLSANVYKQVILAPRVAKSCEPGQFIILRVDEHGERIPLTICDYKKEDPFLVHAGEWVRYIPVTQKEYDEIRKADEAGTYKVNVIRTF